METIFDPVSDCEFVWACQGCATARPKDENVHYKEALESIPMLQVDGESIPSVSVVCGLVGWIRRDVFDRLNGG